MSTTENRAPWQQKRQCLLFAACNALAVLRENGVPIGRAIKLVARRFRKRSLGGGRPLRLGHKTMRRHWDKWKATPAENRDESLFETRYKPGRAKAELNPALLPLIAEICVQQACTLGHVLRFVQPTAADGRRLSKRTIYRRVPAREIQKLVFSHRRLTRQARALEQQKTSVTNKVLEGRGA